MSNNFCTAITAPDALIGIDLDDVLEGPDCVPIEDPWEPYATLPELIPEEKAAVVRDYMRDQERAKFDGYEVATADRRYRMLVDRAVDHGKASRPPPPKPKPKPKRPKLSTPIPMRMRSNPLTVYISAYESLVSNGVDPANARRLAQILFVKRGL